MENTMFPGRENYTGPTEGWFGLLHHEALTEYSHDVMERVQYVKDEKPAREVSIRLHNMIYLGGCDAVATRSALYAEYVATRSALYAEYRATRSALDADYRAKCDALYADYRAKCDALDAEILAYIKAHIPDCAWNGRELDFPEA